MKENLPKIQTLNIAGEDVSVMVNPRTILVGSGEKSITYKPRISTRHSLNTVEELIGRDVMRFQNVAAYSRRESDEEAITSILEDKGDIALVNTIPESLDSCQPPLKVLATLSGNGLLETNGPMHLVGRDHTS